MTRAGYCKRFVVGLATLLTGLGMVMAPTAASAATASGAVKQSITVSPSTNLIDLQTVHVAGKDFPANADIATVQCIKGAVGQQGCDLSTVEFSPADASGSFTVDRVVRRILNTGASSHYDCAKAPGACTLAAADISDQTVAASASLSFNPKVPPKKATLTVTPSTNLVDHQLVTLIGGGLAPGSFVSVAECAPGPQSFQTCDFSTETSAPVGTAGGFYLEWPVHRILLLAGHTTTTTVDCAKVTCQVVAGIISGLGSAPVSKPLSFDPAVPPAQQKLFVSPHNNLIDKQLVTVSGNGFTPGAGVTMVECQAGATSSSSCDISNLRTATAGFVGHFETRLALRRFITTSTGLLDCGSAGCTLTAVDASRYTIEHAMAPLSFNPNTPPPVVTVTVTPSTGLHDDQAVNVGGSGLTPLGPVQVSECASITLNGVVLPFCSSSTSLTADQYGHVSATYFVHAVVNGPRGLVGCSAMPGTCSIGISEGFTPVPEAEAPLTFG